MDELSPEEIKKAKEAMYALVDGFATFIAPVYQALKWNWYGEGIPKVPEIRSTLLRLIDGLDEEGTYSTGGLEVWIKKNPAWRPKAPVTEGFHADDEFRNSGEPRATFGIKFECGERGWLHE